MTCIQDDTMKCEQYDKLCIWNFMKTGLKLSEIQLIIYKSVLKVKLRSSSRYALRMKTERRRFSAYLTWHQKQANRDGGCDITDIKAYNS